MTPEEEIKKLKRKVARLEKRLLEKKHYELGMLINSGCTPLYIAQIDAKDQEALSE